MLVLEECDMQGMSGTPGHLQHTGANRSRTYRIEVKSSLLDNEAMTYPALELHPGILPEAVDYEDWIMDMANKLAYDNYWIAAQRLNLPTERMLVFHVEPKCPGAPFYSDSYLRDLLILSKCNSIYYLPDSPMIFTEKRLNRHIRLLNIKLKTYYEMD